MVATARFNTFPDGNYTAKLIRRLLGGKAISMSEYATRMVEAIDELLAMSDAYPSPKSLFGQKEFDHLIELDGRVEALRIRLGIEALAPKPHRASEPGRYAGWTDGESNIDGDFDSVGFTKICLFQKTNDRTRHAEKLWCFLNDATDNWIVRMKSLRAIANELAVAPKLDEDEEDIMQLLVGAGRRMTTTEILSEFDRQGKIKGESTIKLKLAGLTTRKLLSNRQDLSPKGYGLPAWQ